jgi:hypothetical protein
MLWLAQPYQSYIVLSAGSDLSDLPMQMVNYRPYVCRPRMLLSNALRANTYEASVEGEGVKLLPSDRISHCRNFMDRGFGECIFRQLGKSAQVLDGFRITRCHSTQFDTHVFAE